MKKLMILGASILQLPAIEQAKKMGVEVIAVDMNPNAIGFEVEGITKEIISTIDIDKVLLAAKLHNIDGIMTLASDMPMRTVAVVAKEMRLVGISEETALKATNKAVMREALKENGVPIPYFFRISNKNEYFKAIDYFKDKQIKCIVKPADNSGSRGVDLISDFINNDSINAAFEYSKQYSRGGEIIVEEYMEGPEVSVEALSIDGVCHVIQITDKLTTGAPYFVEMGHNEPSMLNQSIQEDIVQIACDAVNAIGIKNGPSHIEIKVTKDGPKIVELGARLGGDNITTHLVPLSTGVDLVECCIRVALGEIPDFNSKIKKSSAIRYLKTKAGVISAINGVDDAMKVNGVCQISIVHHEGEHVGEIRSSVDRVGFVIAQAETPNQAIEICERAIRKIEVKVEEWYENSDCNTYSL